MEWSKVALPAWNAFLNSLSATFIVIGYVYIRKGDAPAHRRWMLYAVGSSGLFLVSYLIKTWLHGTTPYGGEGLIRTIYLMVLFSHLTLAIAIVPLVLVTVVRGLQHKYDRHRKIARWTLPIWLYVSVTGVIVFLMLRPYY